MEFVSACVRVGAGSLSFVSVGICSRASGRAALASSVRSEDMTVLCVLPFSTGCPFLRFPGSEGAGRVGSAVPVIAG